MSTVLLAFTCGWMTLPMSSFLDGEERDGCCPATAYLIDHPKGLAVFDTGLGARFERPTGTPYASGAGLESGARLRERNGERIFFGHDPDFRFGVPQNTSLDLAARG